jgi:hypothetical protein
MASVVAVAAMAVEAFAFPDPFARLGLGFPARPHAPARVAFLFSCKLVVRGTNHSLPPPANSCLSYLPHGIGRL